MVRHRAAFIIDVAARVLHISTRARLWTNSDSLAALIECLVSRSRQGTAAQMLTPRKYRHLDQNVSSYQIHMRLRLYITQCNAATRTHAIPTWHFLPAITHPTRAELTSMMPQQAQALQPFRNRLARLMTRISRKSEPLNFVALDDLGSERCYRSRG